MNPDKHYQLDAENLKSLERLCRVYLAGTRLGKATKTIEKSIYTSNTRAEMNVEISKNIFCVCRFVWSSAGGKNHLNFSVKFKEYLLILDNFACGAVMLSSRNFAGESSALCVFEIAEGTVLIESSITYR